MLAHLIAKLPKIYAATVVLWIEIFLGCILTLLAIMYSMESLANLPWLLLLLVSLVSKIIMIRATRGFTDEFYLSNDWRTEARMLMREREKNDPPPDFRKLKIICGCSGGSELLLVVAAVTGLWMAEEGDEFYYEFQQRFYLTVVIVLTRAFHAFYLFWSFFAIRFITKYIPARRQEHTIL